MEALSTALLWISQAIATWYAAAFVGAVLIFLDERRARRAEPSDADVKRAAALYLQRYGKHALAAIGEHSYAASFAPDGRHRRFLRRVAAELLVTGRKGSPTTDV